MMNSASRASKPQAPSTILYTAWAPFFAGAERALMLLVRSLDPARYKAHVIVGTDGELRSQLESAGVPSTYVELRYADWRKPIPWIQSVGRIAAVARSTGASLIHSNGVPGFQPVGYAGRLLRIPTVVHVRGRLSVYSWFLKPGFQKALFVSQHLLDYAMEQDAKAFRAGAEVVYDGVLPPPLFSETDRQTKLAELRIPTHIPSIVLSGQVVEIKGIWECVEAARLLTAAGVEATYVVMGDDLLGKGETRRKAEEVVRAYGLADRFRFVGFRRDAAALVQLFDIAAVPSHAEPLGLSALEAMAARLPVVGSRVGGIMETVVDGETGLLVPPRDAASLAAALGRLVQDSAFRTQLGRAGRDRATSVFSVQANAQRVQHVYDQVLAARRGETVVNGRRVGPRVQTS